MTTQPASSNPPSNPVDVQFLESSVRSARMAESDTGLRLTTAIHGGILSRRSPYRVSGPCVGSLLGNSLLARKPPGPVQDRHPMMTPRERRRLALALGYGLFLSPTFSLAGNLPSESRATRPDGTWVRILPVARQIPGESGRAAGMEEPNPLLEISPFSQLATELTPEQIRKIDEELLANIQAITNPEERVLALVRAGNYKTALHQYDVSRRAFDRALESVGQISDPLRKDLRLFAILEGLGRLADEQINEAMADMSYSLLSEEESGVTPERRMALVDQAIESLQRAGQYARMVRRPSYLFETIHGIVDLSARIAQKIGAGVNSETTRQNFETIADPLREKADQILVWATELTLKNPSGPWRDQGLVSLSSAAAGSNQFRRGMEIALQIPTPEIRGDALIRLAEAEARRGTPEAATRAYSLAAAAIARIPVDDLRATLTDVLVDSLVSSGRFTDARRSIVLYPNDRQKLDALGAVAKSMGERNMADQAREWINREVPEAYRDRLLRKVSDGVLRTLEGYRSETFLRGPRS